MYLKTVQLLTSLNVISNLFYYFILISIFVTDLSAAGVFVVIFTLTFVAFCVFSFLHSRLRTCTLRSDHEGQSTLMNLLLRNYLAYNLYDQADKLVSKTTFPESASNNEWARYLFYLGKLLLWLLSNTH